MRPSSSQAPTLREEATSDDIAGRTKTLVGEGETDDDVLIVNWEGPDDPENPKNWTYRRKWGATVIVSAFTFISPIASTMIAPATGQVAEQFGIKNTVVIALTASIFVLGYGKFYITFGPLFLGPLSEIFGRSRVLQAANMWFLFWNLGCGFAQNEGQVIGLRLMAGLGGSAPLAIGGGVMSDIWHPEQRGQAIALYSLAPILGPVVGPVTGAWIAEKSTWRWVFWSSTIADAVIQLLGLLYLRETYEPVLLERKAVQIRIDMNGNNEKGHKFRVVRTIHEGADRHWRVIFRKALTRPFILFFREPIIQLLGLYMAFVYGIMYLFLTTIPEIFSGVYHESSGIAGLHYIAFGIGIMSGAQIGGRLIDKAYLYLRDKNEGVGKPEFRLPNLVLGSVFLPIGLLITGWTTQAKTHWIGPDIGMVFVGAGNIMCFQSIQTYIIDCFSLYAASALAAVSFFRAIAGFGFPLFAPAMYRALGYGKGDTVLAVCAIVIGCPAPFLFWKYGERIRNSSRHASKPIPKH